MKVLDIAGLILLALFAWFVWPPLALFAVGVSCLFISWRATMNHKPSETGEPK